MRAPKRLDSEIHYQCGFGDMPMGLLVGFSKRAENPSGGERESGPVVVLAMTELPQSGPYCMAAMVRGRGVKGEIQT